MDFTSIFVRRPVLSMVVSLLILVLGLRALNSLPIRQYPKTENAIVTVSTAYFGADAETVAGFITQPLEAAIAQAEGIDYMSSSSMNGISSITAHLQLNYPADKALTEITTKVNSVTNQLPARSQQPVLTVAKGQNRASLYLGFFSDVLPTNGVTDYLLRIVKPQLDALEGVQSADIMGARQFALRAWLDPRRMAAHGVTATDVYNALQANNYLAALGSTRGQMVSVDLRAGTSLHSVAEFKQLPIKEENGAIVRLADVANVMLGAENYNSSVAFAGKRAVFVGVKVAPDANLLEVVDRVQKAFPSIEAQLPTGLTGRIVYDTTRFIHVSISEVIKTLVEALIIVAIVIYLFLGSFRAVAIPMIAMPLSLIGAFFVMLVLGYTINLLTLLALVLAIGLVVDDAIIVVENVDRHMKEEGKPPLEAAILGAKELSGSIVAMTVVLIAVYLPIGFQTGLTGALFSEFAFTLAGAVAVSGLLALTLSPMMCSRIFSADQEGGRFVQFLDRLFDRIRRGYHRILSSQLETWPVMVVMGGLLLCGAVYLFQTSAAELAPQEDQGVVLSKIVGPPTATAQQMQLYAQEQAKLSMTLPEFDQVFQIMGTPTVNQGFGGVLFIPWDERERTATELQQVLQQKWNHIAGANVVAFQPPSLPGSSGLPVQFVIKTTEPFQNLNTVVQAILAKAQASGMFLYLQSDLKIDKPLVTVNVDHDMVASLGLTEAGVGRALGTALGGGYVNYFSMSGRSYRVIPQVKQRFRLNPDQVLDYYVPGPDGTVIQAGTVASLERDVVPETINHFQQMNSAILGGVMMPGVTLGQALEFLRETTRNTASSNYSVDYSGGSRQFMQESGGFAGTLAFSIIIVFLVLAALYESFRDPIVILVSVPMALFGALIFINLGLTTLNIYTQVGLVTLMGLISKHGILIVQFANDLQRHGQSKREAILRAAEVRLRPILMTTAAMVFGVLPLVLATGAGAAGRFAMGLVIFTGLSIGTLFTLFVVPAMYMFLAKDRAGKQLAHEAAASTEV